jgi:hypothetical protein
MTWYYANNAALYDCHEKAGNQCMDKGKGPGCHSTPMIGCPNATNMMLYNTSWSNLGRFRTGGAVLFDGVHSHALIKHVPCGDIRGCGNCHLRDASHDTDGTFVP